MIAKKEHQLKMFDCPEKLDQALKYFIEDVQKTSEQVGVHFVLVPFGVFRNSDGLAGMRQSAQVIAPSNKQLRQAIGQSLYALAQLFSDDKVDNAIAQIK